MSLGRRFLKLYGFPSRFISHNWLISENPPLSELSLLLLESLVPSSSCDKHIPGTCCLPQLECLFDVLLLSVLNAMICGGFPALLGESLTKVNDASLSLSLARDFNEDSTGTIKFGMLCRAFLGQDLRSARLERL
jgi:hypothetical protein